ncbi:MAG: hypothetical protein LUQ48_07305 [Methylococcaceae bacterium]|nr:hypothetical protein [Methylococcaceae bacterium]
MARGDIKGKLPSRSMPGGPEIAGSGFVCDTVQTTSYLAARIFGIHRIVQQRA